MSSLPPLMQTEIYRNDPARFAAQALASTLRHALTGEALAGTDTTNPSTSSASSGLDSQVSAAATSPVPNDDKVSCVAEMKKDSDAQLPVMLPPVPNSVSVESNAPSLQDDYYEDEYFDDEDHADESAQKRRRF